MNTPEIKQAAKANGISLYKHDVLMSKKPSLMDDKNRHGIKFYEHPIYGDEASVIAVLSGVAWDTGFYDPWNPTDQSYIEEQAQQLGLIAADVDVWI